MPYISITIEISLSKVRNSNLNEQDKEELQEVGNSIIDIATNNLEDEDWPIYLNEEIEVDDSQFSVIKIRRTISTIGSIREINEILKIIEAELNDSDQIENFINRHELSEKVKNGAISFDYDEIDSIMTS